MEIGQFFFYWLLLKVVLFGNFKIQLVLKDLRSKNAICIVLGHRQLHLL
jgi:hypothetical protein